MIKEVQRRYGIVDFTGDETKRMILEFRREFVIDDALCHAAKKKFSPQKALKVIILVHNESSMHI